MFHSNYVPILHVAPMLVENRQFELTSPLFGATVGDEPVGIFLRFSESKKIIAPGPSCGAVCVILRLAVLVQCRLVTDRQTDKRRRHIAYSVAR